jgi:hypothetical protein
MSASEDVHRLQSQLEHQKSDLREHTSQINEKLQEARAQLSPTKVVQQRIFLLSGLAFALGFALGYRGVAVEEFGKPVARAVLTTSGKQAATRAIRGK